MLGLIQRVSEARVVVAGEVIGEIDRGILLLLGIEKDDNAVVGGRLLDKILAYRIFPDEAGQMNLSLRDIRGGLLVVSQFTLAANTKKGLRPSFSSAAAPKTAEAIYDEFVSRARAAHSPVATGRFGADMQVQLVNDGPVTFMLTA